MFDQPRLEIRGCLRSRPGFVSQDTIIVCQYSRAEGHDSSASIVTAYGLDGPGIESRGGGGVGRDLPHLSRPALRPTQPPVQSVPGLSRV